MSTKSVLEDAFETALAENDLPKPTKQFKFALPRRYQADFAWLSAKVLVEINGGQWVKSGHSSGKGLQRDAEKNNLAVLRGYRVLVFTTTMLKRDMEGCVETVRKTLGLKESHTI